LRRDEVDLELEKIRGELARLAAEDLRFLMDCPQGRRFLRRLFGLCGYHDSVTTHSSKIYTDSAKRDVAVAVRDWMMETGVSPDQMGVIMWGDDGEYRDVHYERQKRNVG
jgi:hypothetical protein